MTPPKSNGRRSTRHRILRQLGHGNLTRIFLATPRSEPGELVVLELVHPELAKDDDFRALFLDQAAATLSLRHPLLVRTLDVVADAHACGLTLEFLQGQTLARVLERVGRQRFPVDLHLHILSKVLEALDYVHEFAAPGHPEPGFMHRDVCPSNVFITYDGQIKLLGTGFGNAVRALEAKLGRPLLDVRYGAPEVLLGFPSGSSADLFAVGVLVWEAATRQARASSDDPRAVVRRRTNGEELALESAWPDAAEPLIALCARALALNPRDRYPTARAFRADLDAYLSRAAEPSDAVLARLPELMEASFGSEREQMQLFIGARLDGTDRARAASAGAEVDDELTAHEDEWAAQTNTKAPLAERAACDAGAVEGVRTGLRRSRQEASLARASALRETGVHEKGPRESAEQPPPSIAGRSVLVSRLLDPQDVRAAVNVPELPEPPLPSSLEPPAHERTTAGHQAYSSNLDSTTRSRRSRLRLSPDLLGAAALGLGSLVAAYSMYRHAQRDKKPEYEKLATQAEARATPPSPATSEPVRRLPPALPAVAPVSGAASAPEPRVEVEALPALGPAFFDGHAASSIPLDTPPSLRADELPAIDPALRSLQDAIVMAAKAHRLAVENRRAKRSEPSPRAAAPMAPRPIDEADPYRQAGEP